jgi:protein-S-isoprenylcysteine O-methyltransferase Ste14
MTTTALIILLYFVLITILGFAEIFLQKRFAGEKPKKPDRELAGLLIPFYLAVYMPLAEYAIFKPGFTSFGIVSGFTLLILGIAFRITGMLTLRHNFSTAAGCREGSTLITSGIYRYVRHPLYMSVLIVASAGCLLFSSIFCWLFIFITIYSVLTRIRKEEKLLMENYPDYAEYCRKTKKLIPYIF